MSTVCKQSNCDFTIPILSRESLGDSLSSINYNFESIDNELCRVANKTNSEWIPAYSVFSSLSGEWFDAINILGSLSSCWNTTTNTVNELSGFWLKPITIIYPYPFPENTDINTIQLWLNENFPVKNGNCFNFIVGQELYVHSPEYTTINRIVSNTGGTGNKVVNFTYTCDCIGRGSYTGVASKTIDCGLFDIQNIIPDAYINKFVGVKFIVDSNFQWTNGTKIFG